MDLNKHNPDPHNVQYLLSILRDSSPVVDQTQNSVPTPSAPGQVAQPAAVTSANWTPSTYTAGYGVYQNAPYQYPPVSGTADGSASLGHATAIPAPLIRRSPSNPYLPADPSQAQAEQDSRRKRPSAEVTPSSSSSSSSNAISSPQGKKAKLAPDSGGGSSSSSSSSNRQRRSASASSSTSASGSAPPLAAASGVPKPIVVLDSTDDENAPERTPCNGATVPIARPRSKSRSSNDDDGPSAEPTTSHKRKSPTPPKSRSPSTTRKSPSAPAAPTATTPTPTSSSSSSSRTLISLPEALPTLRKLSKTPTFLRLLMSLKRQQDTLERSLKCEYDEMQQRKAKSTEVATWSKEALERWDEQVENQQMALHKAGLPNFYPTKSRVVREAQKEVLDVLGGMVGK